eukprot:c35811_g1_i1 orf=19-273(-)
MDQFYVDEWARNRGGTLAGTLLKSHASHSTPGGTEVGHPFTGPRILGDLDREHLSSPQYRAHLAELSVSQLITSTGACQRDGQT